MPEDRIIDMKNAIIFRKTPSLFLRSYYIEGICYQGSLVFPYINDQLSIVGQHEEPNNITDEC
jgi:hypothetical protein